MTTSQMTTELEQFEHFAATGEWTGPSNRLHEQGGMVLLQGKIAEGNDLLLVVDSPNGLIIFSGDRAGHLLPEIRKLATREALNLEIVREVDLDRFPRDWDRKTTPYEWRNAGPRDDTHLLTARPKTRESARPADQIYSLDTAFSHILRDIPF